MGGVCELDSQLKVRSITGVAHAKLNVRGTASFHCSRHAARSASPMRASTCVRGFVTASATCAASATQPRRQSRVETRHHNDQDGALTTAAREGGASIHMPQPTADPHAPAYTRAPIAAAAAAPSAVVSMLAGRATGLSIASARSCSSSCDWLTPPSTFTTWPHV